MPGLSLSLQTCTVHLRAVHSQLTEHVHTTLALVILPCRHRLRETGPHVILQIDSLCHHAQGLVREHSEARLVQGSWWMKRTGPPHRDLQHRQLVDEAHRRAQVLVRHLQKPESPRDHRGVVALQRARLSVVLERRTSLSSIAHLLTVLLTVEVRLGVLALALTRVERVTDPLRRHLLVASAASSTIAAPRWSGSRVPAGGLQCSSVAHRRTVAADAVWPSSPAHRRIGADGVRVLREGVLVITILQVCPLTPRKNLVCHVRGCSSRVGGYACTILAR